MSILDKTKNPTTQMPQMTKPGILTAHPNAKNVPPELMAAALNCPANCDPKSYAKGMRDGHKAAMTVHGGMK